MSRERERERGVALIYQMSINGSQQEERTKDKKEGIWWGKEKKPSVGVDCLKLEVYKIGHLYLFLSTQAYKVDHN